MEIISKFWDKITLNLNSIFNENIIQVLEQIKTCSDIQDSEYFLNYGLIKIITRKYTPAKGRHSI